MNREKFEALLKKYEAGESDLAEEQLLVEHARDANSGLQAWSEFLKQNKKPAPAHLRDTIWSAIQRTRRKKRRRTIGILSVAASVLLVISVLIRIPGERELTDEEKAALLKEVNAMFVNEKNVPEKDILYEDELIIIYTAVE